jgi:undecaprenyl pyrophosphate phosphatase UppP
VGVGLKVVIEKVFMRGVPHAEIEDLFSNLPLIAGALAAVGVLIIYAGLREGKAPRQNEVQTPQSCIIGIVQGICLPFRGFSRSGSTISTGLLLGLPKQKLEEYSFALAVVLTPPVIAQEVHRLLKEHALSGGDSLMHLFAPGLVGMVFSFPRRFARVEMAVRLAGGRTLEILRLLLPHRRGGRAGRSLHASRLTRASEMMPQPQTRRRHHHAQRQ